MSSHILMLFREPTSTCPWHLLSVMHRRIAGILPPCDFITSLILETKRGCIMPLALATLALVCSSHGCVEAVGLGDQFIGSAHCDVATYYAPICVFTSNLGPSSGNVNNTFVYGIITCVSSLALWCHPPIMLSHALVPYGGLISPDHVISGALSSQLNQLLSPPHAPNGDLIIWDIISHSVGLKAIVTFWHGKNNCNILYVSG